MGKVAEPRSKRRGDETTQANIIETQLAVVVRLMESIARRGTSAYQDMDRAGYLLARALDTVGPVSIQTLASIAWLEPTTVTRKIGVMETRGLIQRSSDPSDRRVSLVDLSAKGREAMEQVRSYRRGRVDKFLAEWKQKDKAELARLLTDFNRSLVDAGVGGFDSELRLALVEGEIAPPHVLPAMR
jgi:DNA-binding MarR family transcriptional regulator